MSYSADACSECDCNHCADSALVGWQKMYKCGRDYDDDSGDECDECDFVECGWRDAEICHEFCNKGCCDGALDEGEAGILHALLWFDCELILCLVYFRTFCVGGCVRVEVCYSVDIKHVCIDAMRRREQLFCGLRREHVDK
jgi:hypothetical protein